MTDYYPAPGSLAEKAIAHLEEHGGQLTPNELANLFGEPPKNVMNMLRLAVKYKLLQHHQGGRGRSAYAMPGWQFSFDDAQPTTPAPAATKRKDKKAATTRKPREARASTRPEPSAAATPIASLWDDGDLVLSGVSVNEDNASVTLTDDQARQVHRFMERIYGPNKVSAA